MFLRDTLRAAGTASFPANPIFHDSLTCHVKPNKQTPSIFPPDLAGITRISKFIPFLVI